MIPLPVVNPHIVIHEEIECDCGETVKRTEGNGFDCEKCGCCW